MFIEIVQSLRCPNEHEEGWLVASCERMEGRHILEGTLGCPACRAEYPIRAGEVWFDPPLDALQAEAIVADCDGMRLAAFLELTDDRGFAVLTGAWAAAASAVRETSPTELVLLNPPVRATSAGSFSTVHSRRGIVFASRSIRAAAVDGEALPRLLDAVVPGGRILAPAHVEVPSGVTPIARDASVWVGEKNDDPAPIGLVRRAGKTDETESYEL